MRYTNKFPAKNEDGLVALLVVGIMVILLSLTTIAFTKLMGRESQQALDRQLSAQAYYAAQSGINDAKDYINNHPDALLSGSNCDTLSTLGYPPYLGPGVDTNSDVNKVTCVTADTAPEQLFFQIPDGKSRIFEISTGSPIGGVLFSWDNANATGFQPGNYKTPAGLKTFSTRFGWNGTSSTKAPVLELSYYPMPNAPRDVSDLLTYSRTIFLYPTLRSNPTAVGASAYAANTQPDASIINNSCQSNTNLSTIFKGADSVYHCNTIVTPIIEPGGAAPNHLFVKISAFYGPASLAVRAVDNTGSRNALAIAGAQAILDATGKGGTDVLKRLQTIVDYRPTDIEPGDTLETVMGLCKRLEYNLTIGSPQIYDPNPSVDPDNTSAVCHAPDIGL